MLEKIIDWLNIPYIGVVVSLVFSLILNIVILVIPFIIMSRQKPKYIVKTKPVIKNEAAKYECIEVLYNKKQVTNISETRLYFWNAGKKSIRQFDLLKANPLNIHIPSCVEVYKVECISTNDVQKTLEIKKKNNNNYELMFDSMQRNDGICFKILHSGDEKTEIAINGKLDNLVKIRKGTAIFEPDTISFLTVFNNTFVKVFLPLFLTVMATATFLYSIINRIEFQSIILVRKLSENGPPAQMFEGMDLFVFLIIISTALFSTSIYSFLKLQTSMPSELLFVSKNKVEYKPLYEQKQQNLSTVRNGNKNKPRKK